MFENILELAKEIEYNGKQEAQAVYDYTELLKEIEASGLDGEGKAELTAEINEIISDELNHSQKLLAIYTKLVGVQPAKD